jgi:hypothetical protein
VNRLWLVALSLMLAAHAEAQIATPAPIRQPEPASLDDRYPPTRDYRKERTEMVIEAFGGWKHNTENGYPVFRSAVAKIAGMMQYAVSGSPVLKSGAPGDPSHTDDDLLGVFSKSEQAESPLAIEMQAIIDRFLATPLASGLDVLVNETRYFPPTDPVQPAIAALLPELGEARQTAKFNVSRMALAHRRTDRREFLRALTHNLAIQRAISGQPSLISHSLNAAIDASTFGCILDCGLKAALDPELCRGVLEVTRAFPIADWSLAVRGEGLLCMATIDWMYAEGEQAAPSPQAVPAEQMEAPQWAPRVQTLELADTYFSDLARVFDPDRAIAEAALAKVRALHEQAKESGFRTRFRPFVLLMPTLEATLTTERQARVLRDAARVAAAADLFRADRGAYPQAVSDLVPKYLDTLPIDWFSPTRDALRLRAADPLADRLGRSYLIYSVGHDGRNDGGVEDPVANTRAIQRSPGFEGLDFILNWRPAPAKPD